MSTAIEKEIESLRNKLESLEEEKQKEERERALLDGVYSELQGRLEQSGISIDAFILYIYKDAKRVVNKTERQKAKQEAKAPAADKPKATKKRSKKKRSKKKTVIKIPAGTYKNIPDAPDRVFDVKEKGPRPKLVKAYAEKIGIEQFMEECRVD